MIDNTLALAIRAAAISPEKEAVLVKAIEEYGTRKWHDGYDEGISGATSRRA